jgi:hypothetical protein
MIIINQIVLSVWKFIWKGGKNNDWKFHLINWKVIWNSKDRGGLGIPDLAMMNLAMGGKLLWRMISSSPSWWKRALVKKYFIGTKHRCLEQPVKEMRESSIFKPLKETIHVI